MGDLAPVIAFDQARRTAMARQLQRLGVPTERITATRNDAELADLWTRERTLASLRRLTGDTRWMVEHHSTDELQEIERRVLGQLMGSDGRSADQLIYSLGGRQPGHPSQRHRQRLREWGIPA